MTLEPVSHVPKNILNFLNSQYACDRTDYLLIIELQQGSEIKENALKVVYLIMKSYVHLF